MADEEEERYQKEMIMKVKSLTKNNLNLRTIRI